MWLCWTNLWRIVSKVLKYSGMSSTKLWNLFSHCLTLADGEIYEVLFHKRSCMNLSALMNSFCTRKIKHKCDTDTWPPLDGWQRTEFSKEHMNHVQTSNQRNPSAQHTALYSYVTATAFILTMLLNKPYSVLNSNFNLVTVTSPYFYYINISLLHYE